MAREIRKIIHPSASLFDFNGICQAVNIVKNQPLVFNGYIADTANNTTPILDRTGVTRVVELQAVGDLSTIYFTITGKQNGQIVTEDIIGPNSTTPVESSKFYDEIISIVPNNDSTLKLNVALGNKVYILTGINLEKNAVDYNLSLSTNQGTDILTKMYIYNSLENIKDLGFTYKDLIGKENFLHLLDQKTSNFKEYILPKEKVSLAKNILTYLEIHSSHSKEILFNFIQL